MVPGITNTFADIVHLTFNEKNLIQIIYRHGQADWAVISSVLLTYSTCENWLMCVKGIRGNMSKEMEGAA